jgi:tetratricopeptide (TPR) repeat protein
MRWVGPVLVVVAVGLSWSGAWAQSVPIDRAIASQQRRLAKNPYDAAAYFKLGDAYVQKSRESGDLKYLDLAENALRRTLEIAPRTPGAVRHLAYVHVSRHEFRRAALEAARALEMEPSDTHAWGVLGDAHLELGEYDKAEAAYSKMMALGDGTLYAYGRLSGLKSLRGDVEGAMTDLRRGIEAGRAERLPRESMAWAQWQLGVEHFAVGELDAAEARYQEALQGYPGYYRALAGLAQVRVAQGRPADAVDLYRRAIAVIPMPEYAAALGDLLTALGRIDEARKQYELVEYIGRLSALNQVLYNRDLAYFYADHDVKLDEALALAQREIESRRDIYGHDVLAWALYKNGRLDEARAAIADALRLGTRDARLLFHAGMIHARLGERERARELLSRALATNPYFHVLHADLARRTLTDLERAPEVAAPLQENASSGGPRGAR